LYTSATPYGVANKLVQQNVGQGFEWTTPAQFIDAIPERDAVRNNPQGYSQLLYMDVFPAFSTFDLTDKTGRSDVMGDYTRAAPIVFYWHGGGFDVGYANNRDGILEVVRHMCLAGYHVIVPEYRRGWSPLAVRGGDATPTLDKVGVTAWFQGDLERIPGVLPTPANGYNNRSGFSTFDNDAFLEVSNSLGGMAIQDSIDAVYWVINNIKDAVLPNAVHQHWHFGNSAGGSICAQLSLSPGTAATIEANPDYYAKWKAVNSRIKAVSPNFGSFPEDFLLLHELDDVPNRPIVVFNMQGNDYLSPLRTNHAFYQNKMQVTTGMFDLWHRLASAVDGSGAKEYTAIGWVDPIGGHGYGQFMLKGLNSNTPTFAVDIQVEFMSYVSRLLRMRYNGDTLPPSHLVFKTVDETGSSSYARANAAKNYPVSTYLITLAPQGQEADALYNPSSGRTLQENTVEFQKLGNSGLPASGKSDVFGYYNEGGSPQSGWGPYWFGEFMNNQPQNYFNPSTDIGVVSVEGAAIRSDLTDLVSNGYYSNFDTRGEENDGYPNVG
jgi:acetyl esterase/lipase